MNFHPWLKAELLKRGFEVIAPKLNLNSGEELDLPQIIEDMKSQIGYLKNDDILLGHSLGGYIILQYLEAVEMTETPRAVVLVASPWKVSKPELRRLFIIDLDADVLMWKAREYVVVHAKDDTMVPIEHGRKLAEAFKANLIETEGQGHFMDTQYPVLIDIIQEISDTPFEFEPGMSLDDDYEEVNLSDRDVAHDDEEEIIL